MIQDERLDDAEPIATWDERSDDADRVGALQARRASQLDESGRLRRVHERALVREAQGDRRLPPQKPADLASTVSQAQPRSRTSSRADHHGTNWPTGSPS